MCCGTGRLTLGEQFGDQLASAAHANLARAIASAHGPILIGDAIHDAFDRVRTLAGESISAPPGQPALDDIIPGLTPTRGRIARHRA